MIRYKMTGDSFWTVCEEQRGGTNSLQPQLPVNNRCVFCILHKQHLELLVLILQAVLSHDQYGRDHQQSYGYQCL